MHPNDPHKEAIIRMHPNYPHNQTIFLMHPNDPHMAAIIHMHPNDPQKAAIIIRHPSDPLISKSPMRLKLLLVAHHWNKSWWHFIEIRWKVLCNIILILIPIKSYGWDSMIGHFWQVYTAVLCGCHESTAASCGLSINSLPASCGYPTVFNQYVMVMFRNFLFWYKSLYLSHRWDWSNIHCICS